MERETAQINTSADRLEAAAETLTEADLGKASTALRQAETRQQLALSTVRQALNAYGAYAGGLLGNVQRTQRAIA
jgi:flagellin-like hook-associated protein FlgL